MVGKQREHAAACQQRPGCDELSDIREQGAERADGLQLYTQQLTRARQGHAHARRPHERQPLCE